MASFQGPLAYQQMMRRKGCLDISSSLHDPRQWPALGESVDLDQKRKQIVSGCSSLVSSRPFIPRQKTNSIGESSASSSKCSSDSSARKSESDTDASSDIQTPTAELSRQNSVCEPNSPVCAPGDTPVSTTDTPPKPEENPCLLRRTSSDDGSTGKKKAPKTKWIPLELPGPNTGLSIQDKLRLRRRQMFSEFPAPSQSSASQPVIPPRPFSERPNRFPPRTYGYSGSYYSNNNHYTPMRPNFGYAGNGGNQRPAQESGYLNWQRPVWKNRPKFRKFQGFRSRDIKYDSEFAGRDGDQFSEYADDNSVQGQHDYSLYDDGSQTPSEWNYYADYETQNGSEMNTMDGSFLSDGYATDEYDPYHCYYPGMEGQAGYYSMQEESESFITATGAELKQLIKAQIEYYFSPENLEKDFFLRQNMSEDGSVLLSLVASFQRIRSLSQDFYLVLEAVGDSEQVELMDGFMVRPRLNPEQWPLKSDDSAMTYYLMDGEIVSDDTNWTYYDERFSIAPVKDEENESGHCDDGYQEGGEEEVEEVASVGGSELEVSEMTEFKVELLREQIEPLAV